MVSVSHRSAPLVLAEPAGGGQSPDLPLHITLGRGLTLAVTVTTAVAVAVVVAVMAVMPGRVFLLLRYLQTVSLSPHQLSLGGLPTRSHLPPRLLSLQSGGGALPANPGPGVLSLYPQTSTRAAPE